MDPITTNAPDTVRAESAARATANGPGERSTDPLAELQATVAEARKAASDVLGTVLDSVRSAVRRALLLLVLAILGAVVLIATLVVGLILLLTGASGAFSAAFGLPTWSGALLVGMIACPLLLLALYLAYRRMERIRLERAKERYADAIRNN